ncbi:hypothetical protein ES332_A07G211500v1 [Gossypium tomentosum]|uniref:Uncharacterized protein n=1 Tax=Gossypium tomentosum TaxID=34277 RepID=A0A5D2PY50_GOSTO|nr:hypothetical protein ES332_A07G211500v1 [Gossypium tomentosum]
MKISNLKNFFLRDEKVENFNFFLSQKCFCWLFTFLSSNCLLPKDTLEYLFFLPFLFQSFFLWFSSLLFSSSCSSFNSSTSELLFFCDYFSCSLLFFNCFLCFSLVVFCNCFGL